MGRDANYCIVPCPAVSTRYYQLMMDPFSKALRCGGVASRLGDKGYDVCQAVVLVPSIPWRQPVPRLVPPGATCSRYRYR